MKTRKITFEIDYVQGVLPEVFQKPRAKMTRAERAAAKAAAKAAAEQEAAPEVMPEAPTGSNGAGNHPGNAGNIPAGTG